MVLKQMSSVLLGIGCVLPPELGLLGQAPPPCRVDRLNRLYV